MPSSVLTLNDNGQLGVKLVDENEHARFQTVTVVAQTHQGVWVTDLPQKCRVIVVGQESISTGEAVRAVDVGPLHRLSL